MECQLQGFCFRHLTWSYWTFRKRVATVLPTVARLLKIILLMEEILHLHHLGWLKPYTVNNGIIIILDGAGFQPSTVGDAFCGKTLWWPENQKISERMWKGSLGEVTFCFKFCPWWENLEDHQVKVFLFCSRTIENSWKTDGKPIWFSMVLSRLQGFCIDQAMECLISLGSLVRISGN